MMYEPREDSLLLASVVKRFCKNKRVLDMGAGCGILSRTALDAGAASVLAVDIDRTAIKKLQKEGITARTSDLFENVTEKFDLIVCNPPYLPLDAREDAESRRVTTGGKNGDEFILKFLQQARKHLMKPGEILLLVSSLTPRKRIEVLIRRQKKKIKIVMQEKLFMEKLEVWRIR